MTKGQLEHVSVYPAASAASMVVQSTALRITEAYYPSYIWVLTAINTFSPSLSGYLVRLAFQ